MFRKASAVRPAGANSLYRFHRFIPALALPVLIFTMVAGMQGSSGAHDPGVRDGAPGAGTPIAGLTTNQLNFFNAGLTNFNEIDSVSGTISNTGNGLGPRFNAESCAQCHAQPATGGTSPFVNPQVAAANDQGATNQVPSFITANGPVREARFPYTLDLRHVDGGVHALFTITGRTDAPGCNTAQDNFAEAAQKGDLIFRIPTPVFGGGSDRDDFRRQHHCQHELPTSTQKHNLGNRWRPNTSGNDGTITRFGWKAQNKSLEIFSGEAYNVEVGVTNELFNTERDQTPGCQFNATPEDTTNFDLDGTQLPSDIIRFTNVHAHARSAARRDRARGRPSTAASSSRRSVAPCATRRR